MGERDVRGQLNFHQLHPIGGGLVDIHRQSCISDLRFTGSDKTGLGLIFFYLIWGLLPKPDPTVRENKETKKSGYLDLDLQLCVQVPSTQTTVITAARGRLTTA